MLYSTASLTWMWTRIHFRPLLKEMLITRIHLKLITSVCRTYQTICISLAVVLRSWITSVMKPVSDATGVSSYKQQRRLFNHIFIHLWTACRFSQPTHKIISRYLTGDSARVLISPTVILIDGSNERREGWNVTMLRLHTSERAMFFVGVKARESASRNFVVQQHFVHRKYVIYQQFAV